MLISKALDALVQIHRENERWDEAEQELQRSAALVDADPDSTPQDRFNILGSLSTLHLERYEFKKAEDDARKMLRIAEIQGDGNEANMSDACEKVANALTGQGRHAEALPFQGRSLELAEKVYTRPHRSLGYRHYNLGVLLNLLQQYDQAIEHLLKAAEIWRVVYKDDDHPDLAYVHRVLALIYRMQGKLDLAERSARRAVEIDRKKWGEGHSNLARSKERLAQVLAARGRMDEARTEYGQYLEVRRRGAESPTASALLVAEYADALLNGPVLDLRDPKEGLRLAQLANEKTQHGDPVVLVLIGKGLFGEGDVDGAIQALEQAAGLLKPDQESDRAKIDELLGSYRKIRKR